MDAKMANLPPHRVIGPCRPNLRKHWSEFTVRLSDELSESGTLESIGSGTPSVPFAGAQFHVSRADISTRLEVVKIDTGLVAIVVGDTLEAVNEEFEMWRVAFQAAEQQLSHKAPKWEWNAIIGPSPHTLYSWDLALAESCRIGPMRLHKSTVYMSEGRPGSTLWDHEINSASGSWPVVVEGTVQAFEYHAVTDMAMGDLTHLCSLLSLALGEPWVPRSLPMLTNMRQYSVPTKAPGSPDWIPVVEQPRRKDFKISSWLGDAWNLTKRNDQNHLRHAVATYREGLILSRSHPSFSLIAFVASIESIGKRHVKLERCGVCGQIRDSGKRFRDPLDRYLDREKFPATYQRIQSYYSKRSKTAHEARLHGSETSSGWGFQLNPFEVEEAPRLFDFVVISDMSRAARDVIIGDMELGDVGFDPWAPEVI